MAFSSLISNRSYFSARSKGQPPFLGSTGRDAVVPPSDWNPCRGRGRRRRRRLEHGRRRCRSQLRWGGRCHAPVSNRYAHHLHRRALMIRIVVFVLCWCATSVSAVSPLGPPVLVVARDFHKQLRPVYGGCGEPSDFVLRDAI